MKSISYILIIIGIFSILIVTTLKLFLLICAAPIILGILLLHKIVKEEEYYDTDYLAEMENNIYEQSNW